MKKLTEKDVIHTLADSHNVIVNAGGEIAQVPLSDFRTQINKDDVMLLSEIAFYIDINKASTLGSTRVDTGGNLGMMATMERMREAVLMDNKGNYYPLSHTDCHYADDGTQIADLDTNALLSTYANLDMMIIIPEYYGRIQLVTEGNLTFPRCWFSPMPLPNGYLVKQQVIGKFKASLSSNIMRSVPGAVTADSQTLYNFWTKAQARSTSHGLAGLQFRNYLLIHMMGKYGWRDSQNCKNSDNTLIWGVGLDGTENTTSSAVSGFDRQKNIKTGHTLALGSEDGKSAVLDSEGGTCHGVSVAGFENPWGQKWEMIGDLCSVGADVYHWEENFVPQSAPTAATFANVDHVTLARPTSAQWGMNIISAEQGQGVYMIPKEYLAGVGYGDNYWYSESGQLWLFGGASGDGSSCGLAVANSSDAWSRSNSLFSARLAYFGEPKKCATLAALVALAAA